MSRLIAAFDRRAMLLKSSNRIRSFVSAFLVFFLCLSAASFAVAQKKPTEFDSHSDDKQLCSDGNSLNKTEYCDFWKLYSENRIKMDATSKAIAQDARNELIKYVQGRVDRYYEETINKKKFNRNLITNHFGHSGSGRSNCHRHQQR